MYASNRLFAAAAAAMFAFVAPAAAQISLETSRPGHSDQVNWNWIGSPPWFFASGAQFGSGGPNYGSGGVLGHVSLATDSGEILEQGYDFFGNFAYTDYVLYTGTGSGPITLTFTNPVSHVGGQIMSAAHGAFTGRIDAYNGNTLLGSFTEVGTSNSNGDNSAIYLGVADNAAEITKVVTASIPARRTAASSRSAC